MERKRVVIDTSVLISGFVFGGIPQKAIRKAFSYTEVCVSPQLLREYREAPIELRNEGKIDPYQSKILLAGIAAFVSNATVIIPKKRLRICRDIEDNMILECCLAAQADFLITGDKDLLEIKSSKLPPKLSSLRIVTPQYFLKLIEL